METVNEMLTMYDLQIDHIQIDNMLNNLIPVFFCPVKELIKYEDLPNADKEVENENHFIQDKIIYSEIQDQDVYIKKFRLLDVAVQEMKLQVETSFVNALLKFVGQLQTIQN